MNQIFRDLKRVAYVGGVGSIFELPQDKLYSLRGNKTPVHPHNILELWASHKLKCPFGGEISASHHEFCATLYHHSKSDVWFEVPRWELHTTDEGDFVKFKRLNSHYLLTRHRNAVPNVCRLTPPLTVSSTCEKHFPNIHTFRIPNFEWARSFTKLNPPNLKTISEINYGKSTQSQFVLVNNPVMSGCEL